MSGGSKSNQKNLPKFYEQDLQQGMDFAQDVSAVGYTPYYGPDVAAFSPMQNASFDSTNMMAGAFNMPTADPANYMPEPTTFANGIQGYSSAPLYNEAVDALAANRPGQKNYIDSFFVNPVTGAPGANQPSAQPVNYEMTAKRGK